MPPHPDIDDLTLDDLFTLRAKTDGLIVKRLAEADEAESFRADGATSIETWTVERFGVSGPTARSLTQLAHKAPRMPNLVESLCQGEISLDKVRAVADVATPRNDRALCTQAKQRSVRELADIARTAAAQRASVLPRRSQSEGEEDMGYVRFNDRHRTMTAQLPSHAYAETKSSIQTRAHATPAEKQTPWDQRCARALMDQVRSSNAVPGTTTTSNSTPETSTPTTSPYVVVAHTSLATLVDEAGTTTPLAGELEHLGLIDTEMVTRIACDATIIIGVDNDVGHTLYEGRAERFATDTQRREVFRRDRTCRFPACTNVTFTNVHHVVPWKRGGRTDIDNICLLCEFHHHRVHSNGWSMTGNANEELTIVTPGGRVMTSRPSEIWTRVSAS